MLIGRVPLRRLLTHGLGEALSFGKEFTHHQVHSDGDVTAYFADGSSDRADLLVGADGAGSTVARALAGRATSTPVGISGVAGPTPSMPAPARWCRTCCTPGPPWRSLPVAWAPS